jgi:superoxide dismutase, Fe-Mn family
MITLPELTYTYDALAPHISAEVMQLHHQKHHQTYVDKFNAAIAQHPDIAEESVESLLSRLDTVPEDIRTAVRNHGGGHYNHSLFWKTLSPHGGGEPFGELAQALTAKYGSFESFVEQFNTQALGLFGSGWVWLTPELEIVTSPNQDSPLMNTGVEPLMGLDVWEHAYYLDYKNKRDDYIAAWWHVVDWEFVAGRYKTV